MKGKRLAEYIPVYPKGCSVELLAVKAGYVKKPSTISRLNMGVKRLKKDMAWCTLFDESLVERLLPMQLSTRKALMSLGVPNPDTNETVYLSKGKPS